ncbi:MAG: DNA-3-methyladenine glycosylase, partial [Rhabdochlamydiaceae bacterium]
MNVKLLTDFYQREDVVTIAKELMGKVLFSRFDGKVTAGIIIETEAYRGIEDRACHAYKGRRTPRTEVMYSPGGVTYIYLCYGMHH